MAQATKLLPTPVGPSTKTFSCVPTQADSCTSARITLLSKPTCAAIVDLFNTSVRAEFGVLQPPSERMILAPVPLLIYQQPQACDIDKLTRSRILLLRLESL